MLGRLAPRDRSALVLGAAVIVALVACSKGAPKWVEWRRVEAASVVELNSQLARDRTLVDALPQSLDSLEARIQRFKTVGSGLVIAEGSTSGASAVGRLVTEAVRLAGMRIGSIRVEVDTTPGTSLLPVNVDVSATGDVVGLAELLERIEGGESFLSVEKLEIAAQNVEATDDVAEDLAVRFRVAGLVLPRGELSLMDEVEP